MLPRAGKFSCKRMATKMTNGFTVRPFRDGECDGVRAVIEASYGERATPRATYEWWSSGFSGEINGFVAATARGQSSACSRWKRPPAPTGRVY